LCNENAFVTESVCKGPDEFVVLVEKVGKLNRGIGISEVKNRVIWKRRAVSDTAYSKDVLSFRPTRNVLTGRP